MAPLQCNTPILQHSSAEENSAFELKLRPVYIPQWDGTTACRWRCELFELLPTGAIVSVYSDEATPEAALTALARYYEGTPT